jgi:rare lipoprotein A (peptidoglycan hydrolase)
MFLFEALHSRLPKMGFAVLSSRGSRVRSRDTGMGRRVMIRRARSALSGVVVSMFLVAPNVATAATANQLTNPTENRKSHQTKTSRQHAVHTSSRLRRVLVAHSTSTDTATRPSRPRTIAFIDDDASPSATDNTGRTASIRPGGFVQSGIASWYGGQRWHGRLTSSGAVFDQDALTAAHATLPLGTRVRVILFGADKDVVVTINDRPGTRARIIDLSRGAARQLGILDRGVARVTLTEL